VFGKGGEGHYSNEKPFNRRHAAAQRPVANAKSVIREIKCESAVLPEKLNSMETRAGMNGGVLTLHHSKEEALVFSNGRHVNDGG